MHIKLLLRWLLWFSQSLHIYRRSAGDVKILEVACGTGRFATFVKDNYPQAQYTALDLSPFYLEVCAYISTWLSTWLCTWLCT